MPPELVTPQAPNGANFQDSEPSWWNGYMSALTAVGLSPTARACIAADARYVVDKCIFGANAPGTSGGQWPPSRVRKGLVLGAVQSGKTAAMFAISAMALDSGVDILVVLCGTRKALWLQTQARASRDLDRWSIEHDVHRRAARIWVPSPLQPATGDQRPASEIYCVSRQQARMALQERRPIVLFVLKQGDHLLSAAQSLRTALAPAATPLNRPLHMLILDDEADDGSILDARAEADDGTSSGTWKQLPRQVQRLWSDPNGPGATYQENLYASYVAFTATPQANIIQSDHNPLSPEHFVAALRTPGVNGSVSPPRSLSYREPSGIAGYYCGGDVFYDRFRGTPGSICKIIDLPSRGAGESVEQHDLRDRAARADSLARAMRCYLVAGACRVHLDGRTLGAARAHGAGTLQELKRLTPPAHTMLVHASGRLEDHFQSASEVFAWCNGDTESAERHTAHRRIDGPLAIDATKLGHRIQAEQELWVETLRSYQDTLEELGTLPGAEGLRGVGVDNWPRIRDLIVNEIAPNLVIRVVNSDPSADDRPQFDPQRRPDGAFGPAPDVYTVFVSGNVMSRGLTLEGLCTTLFLRGADEPAADTQSQMQRWFGYRGSHLNWVRAFMSSDQLRLFREYHEADIVARTQVINAMNSNLAQAPLPMVLQRPGFVATRKIADLRTLPLCPGATPFVRVVERRGDPLSNIGVLELLIRRFTWRPVVVAGVVRGLKCVTPATMLEAAQILDRMRFAHHRPDPTAPEQARWTALDVQVGPCDDGGPLWRGPVTNTGFQGPSVAPNGCPYSIAAYLRLWHAALTRRIPGMFPTDDRSISWSLADLSAYRASAPTFNLGIRFGSDGLSSSPTLAAIGVTRTRRAAEDGILISTWGSRNPSETTEGYLGDQWFDYHGGPFEAPKAGQDGQRWRPRGHPGALLFHVLAVPDSPTGETLATGVCLPLGGPDCIPVLRR